MSDDANSNGKDVTLRDVVNHMSIGFGQIDTSLRKIDERLNQLETKTDRNHTEILANRDAIENLYDHVDELKKADLAIENTFLRGN